LREAELYTGAHEHASLIGNEKPLGELVPMQGVSGSDGYLETTYTAPEPAGVVRVTGSGFHPTYGFFSGNFTIGIRVSGLQELPDSTDYDKIGSNPSPPIHTRNHYGTPSMVASLQNLARKYIEPDAFPTSRLGYNDMSLPWGGLFDLDGNWSSGPRGHKSHRLGKNVDLRLVPENHKNALRRMIERSGLVVSYVHEDHWHLQQQ